MPSFTLVTDNLKTLLQDDAGILSFCNDTWGRVITVKKVFKPRTEIKNNEFPIIMVTRPKAKKNLLTPGVKDGDHTVLLFCGIYSEDREKAQDYLVAMEELIEDAIVGDYTLGGTVTSAIPTDTANDEGHYHPVYFLVVAVEIKHRR